MKEVKNPRDFVGINGETPPTLTVDDAGSTYLNLDTKVVQVWSGTAWK